MKIRFFFKLTQRIINSNSNFKDLLTIISAKDLQTKKWRHIRDNYTKYMNQEKNIPSGSGASKRKKYHYADMFSFLKPTVEKRR